MPVEALPAWAEVVAKIIPVTHLPDGINWVVLGAGSWGDYWIAIGVLGAWTLATALHAALAIRRSAGW